MLRELLAPLRGLPCAQRFVEHLHLDVQERQRLGNRVVQLLGEQVALLGHREFLVARHEALVLDGRSQVLAQRLQHLPLRGAEFARLPK